MKFTLFGIILVFLLAIYIFKNIKNPKLGNDMFIYSVLGLLVLDIGYVAKIGSFTVEYNYIFSIINFIFSVFFLFKNRPSKKNVVLFCILFGYLFISMFLPFIFNIKLNSVAFNDSWDLYFGAKDLQIITFSKHSFMMFARTVIFILSFYCFCKNTTKDDLINYSKKIFYVSNFIIILSMLEFLISNCINEFAFRRFCLNFFGHSDSTYELSRMTNDGIYLPMALMREPSSYVRSLFIFCINNIMYILFVNYKNKITIYNIVILILILLLSKSLSAIIYLVGIFILLWCLIKQKKRRVIVLIFSIILLLFASFIMKDRFLKFFDSFSLLSKSPKDLYKGSELIRLYSINNNIQYFFKYFIFGCGFGTIYCYSSIVTLLVNFGVIGTVIYIYIIYHITSIMTKDKRFSWLTILIIVLTHLLIGHLSYLIYLETAGYLYLCIKQIDILIRNRDKNEK